MENKITFEIENEGFYHFESLRKASIATLYFQFIYPELKDKIKIKFDSGAEACGCLKCDCKSRYGFRVNFLCWCDCLECKCSDGTKKEIDGKVMLDTGEILYNKNGKDIVYLGDLYLDRPNGKTKKCLEYIKSEEAFEAFCNENEVDGDKLEEALWSCTYYVLGETKNGKPYFIHYAFANFFLGKNNDGSLVVDHINENKLDNRKVNLQRISSEENLGKYNERKIENIRNGKKNYFL